MRVHYVLNHGGTPQSKLADVEIHFEEGERGMPTITEEQQERSREYKERHPASVCTCGHTGDGAGSMHSDSGLLAPGHGACIAPGCACLRFRWDRFRIPYMTATGVK